VKEMEISMHARVKVLIYYDTPGNNLIALQSNNLTYSLKLLHLNFFAPRVIEILARQDTFLVGIKPREKPSLKGLINRFRL